MLFLTLTSTNKWFIFIISTILWCLFFYGNFLSFILIFFNLKLGFNIRLFIIIILLYIYNQIIIQAIFIINFSICFCHISLNISPLPLFMLWTFYIFSTTFFAETNDRKMIYIYIVWWLSHHIAMILTKFFIFWRFISWSENMPSCFH